MCRLWNWLGRGWKWLWTDTGTRRGQTCFCYCPRCKNELISSESWVDGDDIYAVYCCSECGYLTAWDFGHYPVPILLTRDDDATAQAACAGGDERGGIEI